MQQVALDSKKAKKEQRKDSNVIKEISCLTQIVGLG